MAAKQSIKFKPGVRLSLFKKDACAVHMSPQIGLAIVLAGKVFNEMGYDLVVTSVCDGKHGAGSMHYLGNAIDCRRRHLLAGAVNPLFLRLREALPKDLGFDVVLEKTHFHIEYDVNRLAKEK